MQLEREWYYNGWEVVTDFPINPQLVGRSLKWLCIYCGSSYAMMKAKINGRKSNFSFISGCCPSCPGNKFCLPGSVEAGYLCSTEQPRAWLALQLQAELEFLSSPAHPYNQGPSE